MRALFECELEYLPSPHLMQIYAGFFELQKKGVVNLTIRRKSGNPNVPIITVIVNKKYQVIYDTLDGLTWIAGTVKDNLIHFKNTYNVDFYFKRSFHKQLLDYTPVGCKVLPLGLNYNVQPDKNLLSLNETIKDKIKYVMKSSQYLTWITNKRFFYTSDFEYYQTQYKQDRILFLTRLWNPIDAKSDYAKRHREQINAMRVECIEACQKEYKGIFTGGLIKDDFADKHYRSFIIPNSLTDKSRYLQAVKEHSICIATTGLHDSIGWKLGEYVAASRAILSEPLKYELPGDFAKGKNYFEFENADQLLQQISILLENRALVIQTMQNNYDYYNNYVKPEKLVLNTLFSVINTCEKE